MNGSYRTLYNGSQSHDSKLFGGLKLFPVCIQHLMNRNTGRKNTQLKIVIDFEKIRTGFKNQLNSKQKYV